VGPAQLALPGPVAKTPGGLDMVQGRCAPARVVRWGRLIALTVALSIVVLLAVTLAGVLSMADGCASPAEASLIVTTRSGCR
jgi:hypothetical protein